MSHKKIQFSYILQDDNTIIKSFQGYNTSLKKQDIEQIARVWLEANAFGTDANPMRAIKSVDAEESTQTKII